MWNMLHALFMRVVSCNCDDGNNNNNNNIRLISQDKPLDHNSSYIYTSVSQMISLYKRKRTFLCEYISSIAVYYYNCRLFACTATDECLFNFVIMCEPM